jgi:hypothetical protein
LDGPYFDFRPKDQPKSTVREVSSSGAGAGEFHAEPLPERLTRGRYIVEGPAHCFECHSEPDFKNALGQPRPGSKGAGQIIKNEAYNGEPFPEAWSARISRLKRKLERAPGLMRSLSAPFVME